MKQNAPLYAFNRGVISKLALARTDVQRVALSAEEQTNWMPKKLGPMSLRPGLEYIGATKSNAAARLLPFVFAVDDTALVELTPGIARFWVDDALVTFPTVSTAITNGDFATNLTGWTDADEGVIPYSLWASGGLLQLVGDGINLAARHQQVTVPAGDVGAVHALKVVVHSGDCVVNVGTTAGGQEYVPDTTCNPGTTTVTFTPTGNFYLRLSNSRQAPGRVASVALASGVLEVATPWTTEQHIDGVRVTQSGDVIFAACFGVRQQRIERRAGGGWGVVDYVTCDGPFRSLNATATTIYSSSIETTATLVASRPIFSAAHVGALFSLNTQGQQVAVTLTDEGQYSGYIRVFGAGDARAFTITRLGTWAGTLTLQRSLGEPDLWEDTATTYTTNASVTFDDGLANQIVYYRLGFNVGDYTSGNATVTISYAQGTTTGAVRITSYAGPTVVTGDVVRRLSSVDPTTDWAEGAWSDYRGFPSAVALHEGRLCWAGKANLWCSVTDSFHSFDIDYEGDAGPIIRSIGKGPVDKIHWMSSGARLVLGGGGAEHSVRSSSLDEPITPTNLSMKAYTSRGSSTVAAVDIDQSIAFVDRSGSRVYLLTPDSSSNHAAAEATVMSPEIAKPSVVRMAAQRNPDTRLHCVRSDGKVAVLVYDQVEDLNAWILVETDGVVEDVVTLPVAVQDETYYVVARTINGSTVRYLEKWARDDDCLGGAVSKQADAFKLVTNAPASATVAGLSHLIGESVVCWADGKDFGTFTVSAGGTITLPSAVSQAVVGLTYRARFKSVKLAFADPSGTALTQTKRVDHLALILANTHYQGLQYGPDFDTLDDLPLVENGEATAADTVWEEYDQESAEFNGEYDTDARICLQAQAPRPCTVLAAVIGIKTNAKL